MLAAVDHWGVPGALQRFNGMFAFAIWDRDARALTLARDRIGEKPLYYGRMKDVFLFGSELKALARHPAFAGEVDRDALAVYLRHICVPAPHSIWQGISKLPPAHYIEVRDGGRTIGPPIPYWDFRHAAESGAADPLADGPELVGRLEALLSDAVALRMEADVPLGAFLSGGIDSSTIVALMQKQSAQPVRTFTIGFHEDGYDEALHARAVAAHLGTDHTEMYVTSQDALALVPRLASIWDEPFSDSSQIPTYLVSELTRRHVKVSLSGDAGDELFGGYHRYIQAMRIWKARSWSPAGLRSAVSRLLGAPIAGRAADALGRLPRLRTMRLADRLPRAGQALGEPTPMALYRYLMSQFTEPDALVIGGREPATPLTQPAPPFADFRHTMMYLDTLLYLPDDILAKVDRASMAVSLESRIPFLDHRVVEFAWRLPISAKIRGGTGKHILREVLYRHVPKHLVERPKMGFGVPMASWLRGPLRGWAESLLDETRLRDEGFFDPAKVRRIWDEFNSGKRGWEHHLWGVLMFQAWWAEHRSDRPSLALAEPPPQKRRA
jgi:asparagine synthase (glutamine-hydrolysing)